MPVLLLWVVQASLLCSKVDAYSTIHFTPNGTLPGHVPVLKIPYEENDPNTSNAGQCSCGNRDVSWNIAVSMKAGYPEEGFMFKFLCAWPVTGNQTATGNAIRWSVRNIAAYDWTQVIAVKPWSNDCCCTFHSEAGFFENYYQGACIGHSSLGYIKQGAIQPHLPINKVYQTITDTWVGIAGQVIIGSQCL